MEAYGIIVTGVSLFGMLGLLIAGLHTDDGAASTSDEISDETVSEVADYKRAA